MNQTNWLLNGGGWFVLALVTAGLAEQKNRSRFSWFVLSLILGPLATALVVIGDPAPTADLPTLHPVSSRSDRWFVLGSALLLMSGVLAVAAAISGNVFSGGGAVASLCLFGWMLALRFRATAQPQ